MRISLMGLNTFFTTKQSGLFRPKGTDTIGRWSPKYHEKRDGHSLAARAHFK
jgi:hypothetical protein